jgi:hypothetical protein
MYREADWTRVRCLNSEGNSISSIARSLQMSRTTVRRLISMDAAPQYGHHRETTEEELRPLARALISLAEQLLSEQDRDSDDS